MLVLILVRLSTVNCNRLTVAPSVERTLLTPLMASESFARRSIALLPADIDEPLIAENPSTSELVAPAVGSKLGIEAVIVPSELDE